MGSVGWCGRVSSALNAYCDGSFRVFPSFLALFSDCDNSTDKKKAEQNRATTLQERERERRMAEGVTLSISRKKKSEAQNDKTDRIGKEHARKKKTILLV